MLDALLAEARLRWGLDPADGVHIVATERLIASPIDPGRPLLLVPSAIIRVDSETRVEPLPGRHGPGAADPRKVLARLYPADHPVGRLGHLEGLSVSTLTDADLAGPLFVPATRPEDAVASPWALPWISARLRQPDGCPWDREQTHESLRKHLLEEAYEVYDALAQGATDDLAAELGDLLLQIVLHAQLASEDGAFDMTDVQARIGAKIIRRHPHVFGDAEARTASDVNRQWEQLKAREREERVDQSSAESALDGISPSMPALAASQEMQERAANLGYDWPDTAGVVAKLQEELAELLAASSAGERAEEVGDLLMVAVNLARREGVEAEAALRAVNEKFRRRFRSVEQQAATRGVALPNLDFAELDELWRTAKADEAEAGAAHRGGTDAARSDLP